MTHHEVHIPKTSDGWIAEVKKAWEMIKLKKEVMSSVAADTKATAPAIAFYVAVAFAGSIGYWIFPREFWGVVYRPELDFVIFRTIMMAAGAIVGAVVISFIAQHLFKGKAKVIEYVRSNGYIGLVGLLGLVPALNIIWMIWMIVLVFTLLKQVHKIGTGEAIASMVLGVIAIAVLFMVLTPVLGLSGLLYFSAF